MGKPSLGEQEEDVMESPAPTEAQPASLYVLPQNFPLLIHNEHLTHTEHLHQELCPLVLDSSQSYPPLR